MSNASSDLKLIVQEGKSAGRPSEADAKRVFEALRTRLGEVDVLGSGRALTASSTRWALPQATTIALVGVALYASLLFFASPNRWFESKASFTAKASAIEVNPPPLAVSVHAADESAPATPVSSSPVPSTPVIVPNRAEPRALVSRASRDTLAEEVAILSHAEIELQHGQAESALTTLGEHERRFANGLLREERIAARVQALCALGRTIEADRQAILLSPHSLHAKHSRRACGTSAKH